jgi:adenylate cyclase class IV
MMSPMLADQSPHQNLEMKFRCPALEAARSAVLQLVGRPLLERQTDTFFRVPYGRLKLREIYGQPAVLIWYDRPNQTEARISSYHLMPMPDPVALKAALTAALGVRGVVRKRREIYLWHNVRIHLDEVADLGTFIEFEAVLSKGEDESTAQERLGFLCRLLDISAADHVGVAYADLLGL